MRNIEIWSKTKMKHTVCKLGRMPQVNEQVTTLKFTGDIRRPWWYQITIITFGKHCKYLLNQQINWDSLRDGFYESYENLAKILVLKACLDFRGNVNRDFRVNANFRMFSITYMESPTPQPSFSSWQQESGTDFCRGQHKVRYCTQG